MSISRVKYKCIKKYPYGPEVGSEAFELIDGTYVLTDCSIVRSEEIENYPEFWELIADEKVFTTEDGLDIYEGSHYWYVVENEKMPDSFTPKMDICNWSNKKKSPRGHKQFSTQVAARKYIDSKKVVFTTEDGVNLRAGDEFWFVDNFYGINKSVISALVGFNKIPTYHEFSTREAAEKFVDENKPMYSKKQILEASDGRLALNPVNHKKRSILILDEARLFKK